MAKSKKPAAEPAAAAAVPDTAKPKTVKKVAKPAAKKDAAKSTKPVAAAGAPVVDTAGAAKLAAMLVAKRDALPAESHASHGSKKPSATIQQLKNELSGGAPTGATGGMPSFLQQPAKPAGGAGNAFGPASGPGRHNQTFGGDASRKFVPRRTSGG
jgi:hypothetical protein